MITVGGSSFTPGSPETLAISGLDATQSTAVFRYSTLQVSGTLAGAVWTFAFTANDSAVFDPTPNRFDCQIVYGDGSLTPVVLRTGERKTGTEPEVPPGTTRVSSITAGTGISCTPNPITDAGTVALSASIGDLSGVTITGGIAARDRLVFNGSVWTDTEPDPLIPRPGLAYRVIVGQAWNPYLTNPGYSDVYRESFHRAAGGSESTGNVELKSSGVAFLVNASGWVEDYAVGGGPRIGPMNPGSREAMYLKVDTSDNSLEFVRGAFVDDADSGFYVVVDYVEG
jgi:hypothetical protein